jgi:hypothetical protein
MKRIITLMVLLFSVIAVYTQQIGPYIGFTNEVHDFGKIKEADGKVSTKFVFINTGSEPLIINDVKASCGCTSPSWTKQPVLPGQKGFIAATFNPKNRPGMFSKSIYVSSNSVENYKIKLTIKGEVIPKEKSLADLYPVKAGSLRMRSSHLTFGKVFHDQDKTGTLEIVNDSEKPIKIGFTNIPSHVDLTVEPETLQPGEKGIINGVFDAKAKDDWGFLVDRTYMLVNGEKVNNGRLTISATIVENFSEWTQEQLDNAPEITFDNKSFDFGKAPQNAKIKHEFTFKNTGKSTLEIRKIKSSCGCTVVKPNKRELEPGESSSLSAVFNTGSRKGQQSKVVTVITNDPDHSVERLYLRGEIIVP